MRITENKLRNMIRECILSESSMSRIEAYVNNYECAIITAWRDKLTDETPNTKKFRHYSYADGKRSKMISGDVMQHDDLFTDEEKKYHNRVLKAFLLRMGYGVTNVCGSYRESGKPESQEESFFVVNLNDDPKFYDVLFKLSERYNQDSFIYSPKGSTEGHLIGTNNYEFPGYGNDINSGKFLRDVQSMFMSRIGNNGFSFTNGRKIEKDDPNREELLNGFDNNYEDDKVITYKDRKAKRMYKRRDSLDESIVHYFGLNTYSDASINAKRAINEAAKVIANEIR